MHDLAIVLEKAESFATEKILAYSDKLVYHDYKFAKRYVSFVEKIGGHIELSDDEKTLAKIGGWLAAASFENQKIAFDKDGIPQTNLVENILSNSNEFFSLFPIDKKNIDQLETAFKEMFFPEIPETLLGKLLSDALTADIVIGNGKKNLKKMYEEMLLHDVNISKKKWFDIAINLSQQFGFKLPYCQEELQPMLEELQLTLMKEKKQLEKTADLALRKELNISDQELKELKKKLQGSRGRDARGIQTIFRTTSKNHYTLNEMVDRKANIMITVNSIIISLILGGVIGKEINTGNGVPELGFELLPIFILTITSIFSIIFAILSIRPEVTHGEFTEDEIRNKSGNLLYYGNFHNMHQRDYEWGFLQMMSDQEYLYSSMIKDIYYLGLTLKKKYTYIRKSLTIFLIGLVSSVVFFFLVTMNCM